MANTINDMRYLHSAQDLREELQRARPQFSNSGALYGDTCGGRTFSDEESALLEARSKHVRSVGAGWRNVWAGPGTTLWTVIDTRPDTAGERELYEEAMASEEGKESYVRKDS